MVCLPRLAAPLPCELYLWPTARSYTGEPVAEIHTFGAPPLLQAVLQAVCAAGARLAQPGEFTLRAFLAGRIDLTQAEAVLGVIDAADPAELHVALSQLAGGLAGPLRRLRHALLDLLAHLEAGLDFADEDISFITPRQLVDQLDQAAEAVGSLAAQTASRGETAELVRVVLAGRPNSGKSSLFNALARDAGALVSSEPGTTRDYLLAEIDLAGTRCLLIDTAGIGAESSAAVVSPPAAAIDRAAQAIAQEQHRSAQIQLVCIDNSRPADDWERAALAEPSTSRIVVLTKSDLPGCGDCPGTGETTSGELSEFGHQASLGRDENGTGYSLGAFARVQLAAFLPVSAHTAAGLDQLRDELRRAVHAARPASGEVVAATATRCHESLRLAAAALAGARQLAACHGGEELLAAEVRMTLDELGKVAGAVYTEDLLDRIFSRFCVGK
jgi:tRNA modification GTPase